MTGPLLFTTGSSVPAPSTIDSAPTLQNIIFPPLLSVVVIVNQPELIAGVILCRYKESGRGTETDRFPRCCARKRWAIRYSDRFCCFSFRPSICHNSRDEIILLHVLLNAPSQEKKGQTVFFLYQTLRFQGNKVLWGLYVRPTRDLLTCRLAIDGKKTYSIETTVNTDHLAPFFFGRQKRETWPYIYNIAHPSLCP